jgi:hypothetical protein
VNTTTSTRPKSARRQQLNALYAELEELAAVANQFGTDIRPMALPLIDRVATAATARFGEMPEPICRHLVAATQAAITGHASVVVRYVDAALYAIDGGRPPRPSQLRLPLAPASSGGNAKSTEQTTERVLEKLRAKRGSES